MAKKEQIQFKTRKITGKKFFKLEAGDEINLLVTSPMISGMIKKKPCLVISCTDLITNEEGKFLCGKVIERTLHEEFPNDGFVGKKLKFIKGEKVQGAENSYNTFEIEEIID